MKRRFSAISTLSHRIEATTPPCIVEMQGIVHWRPPTSALAGLSAALMSDPTLDAYQPVNGAPELVEAVEHDLCTTHALSDRKLTKVMITSGANQAFANLVLSCVDHDDEVVFFAPFYFNHLMCVEMTGGKSGILVGPSDSRTFHPDLDWLASKFASRDNRIKLVTLVNPGNPSGVMLPPALLESAKRMCEQNGAWLVVDNTYCLFGRREGKLHGVYGPDSPQHRCVSGERVANIFSFSKAYGMMGWRLGVVASPHELTEAMAKAHDTIAICASAPAQRLALEILNMDRVDSWVSDRIETLAPSFRILHAALVGALGGEAVRGGSGAIYLMAECKYLSLAIHQLFMRRFILACIYMAEFKLVLQNYTTYPMRMGQSIISMAHWTCACTCRSEVSYPAGLAHPVSEGVCTSSRGNDRLSLIMNASLDCGPYSSAATTIGGK